MRCSRRWCALATPGTAAGLLLAGIAGCAVPPPVPLDRQADVPARWDAGSPADTAPAPDFAHWWRAFGDPALDDLVPRALAGNLSLAAAGERLRAARALTVPADAAWRPNLRFATTGATSPDARESYFQAGFDAQWELGLFGRAAASRDAAAVDVSLAETQQAALQVSLVAEVVRTWLEWRHMQQRVALLGSDVALQRERLAHVEARIRTRQAAADEALAPRAAVAAAEAALADAATAPARQRLQLRLLLGDRNAALPEPEAAPGGALPLQVDQAPADLLRTRPEIRRAELQVLRAAAAAGEARASLYPRLALGGTLSAAWPLTGAAGNATRVALGAGPVIDMPLFDWGARRAGATARDAEVAAALLDYRQAVLEGVSEVQAALDGLRAQRDRVRRAATARSEGETLVAAAATRVRYGLATALDAAEPRAAGLQARLAQADAQLAEQLAFVALYKALGGANPLAERTPR